MIHLHWYTAAVIGLLVFIAGAVAMGLAKDQRTLALRTKLLAAWSERDRLELACALYEKSIAKRDAEILELRAENVILSDSGPPEAA